MGSNQIFGFIWIANHQIPGSQTSLLYLRFVTERRYLGLNLIPKEPLLLLSFTNRKTGQHIHGFFDHTTTSNKETPSVHSDRGREQYAVPPLVRLHLTVKTSRRPTTPFAVSGEPRPPLIRSFQAGHSGRYFSGFSHCLAPTGSSLAENGTLTCSFQRVSWLILTKRQEFVKLLS